MEIVIGIILTIITLLVIGLILRKRIYDAVDRQEIWKMDIMNRNTASQLARMKGLNLSGEALEKFEAWKNKWEFIITKELPDVEDYLYKIEDLADRYRFPSAHKLLKQTDQTLEEIEENVEEMLQELDDLLLSEKESQEKIQEIKPKVDALRKDILHNHYQFGKGVKYFEETIDGLFDDFSLFEHLIDEGDYTKARDLVDQLEIRVEDVEEEMDLFPDLLKTCTTDLPNQLRELSDGIHEMEKDGYRIDLLDLEEKLKKYELRVADCLEVLYQGNVKDAKSLVVDIEERIDEVYDLLEKEAIAKNYVETQISGYEKSLTELGKKFDLTRYEVEELRKTYYFEDRDMESFLVLEKSIQRSKQALDELSESIQRKDKAHSELREQLEVGFEQLEELQKEHEEFKKQIHNLRKDEIEAKEQLQKMIDEVNALQRRLQRSNIPGVPRYIWTMLENATEANDKVLEHLNQKPLDISAIHYALEEAKKTIQETIEQVDRMLEQAYLTEKVIQYANRYRRTYPILAAKLAESERLFRAYEYELSLEQAVEAIEEIEPGALKQIENIQKV